ncbi:54S ribosomal protein L15, mitochondrial [[Candida] railenensis]|uniref:54S ribosomal protein L15, mitochondrial n=1 Tax=[Candida] railenensis TaxID=45579 RepID=A0A9P0VYC5_9ASCO|nr:54S ribosomal protein L15, mitochondrial [[Candida] railenensis]
MFKQVNHIQRGLCQTTFSRSIYLHSGKRVRGLKRNPEEIFKTESGSVYGTTEENLQPLKTFLGSSYPISDNLLLQVLTHKSFGNGIKPYNEKLAALGSKLYNLYCLKHITNKPTTNTETAINGKNLDSIGMPLPRALGEREPLAIFAQVNKLNTVMFWKSYNHNLSFAQSGELKVSGQMMFALIGAIGFSHGKTAAENFIEEKLIEGTPSIENIANEFVEQNIRRGDI